MTNDKHQHILEIYEPGDIDTLKARFTSETPFMSMHIGEILRLVGEGDRPDIALRVTNIAHILWESGGLAKHKICIYTEVVDMTKEKLLNQKAIATS